MLARGMIVCARKHSLKLERRRYYPRIYVAEICCVDLFLTGVGGIFGNHQNAADGYTSRPSHPKENPYADNRMRTIVRRLFRQ